MKLKSRHTIPLTAVLFTLSLPLNAFSQEDKAGFDIEITTKDPSKQDNETLSGGENPETRTNKNSTAPAAQEPAAARENEPKIIKPVVKTVEKPVKEEEKVQKVEDDPLSFNFLYYIIEKFKFSDIVE